MKKWKFFTLRISLLALLLSLNTISFAQLNFCTNTNDASIGETVEVSFYVENFQDIVSFQYSIVWDESILEYQGATNLNLTDFTPASIGSATANQGNLSISWFHQATTGVSVTDGQEIFTLQFTRLQNGSPNIGIDSAPTAIEVTINSGATILLSFCGDLLVNGTLIHGKLYGDANSDCLYDAGDNPFASRFILASDGTATFYGLSNDDGGYFIDVPQVDATYELTVTGIGTAWAACSPSTTVEVVNGEAQIIEQDIGYTPIVDCASMSVELNAPFLRRCFESSYYINYCNIGTELAENAFIDIVFDPFLTVLSSSIPWTNVNGNTYTFPLGDVAIGACGNFTVQVEVSCDADLGQTHCSTAYIFPRENCEPAPANWSGASLEVTGECDDEEVTFTITNNGNAMQESVDFVIIEDEMIMMIEPIQLGAGASQEVNLPANGATWRLEVEQVPFHPGNSAPSFALEGCGTNAMGEFSLGFINNFPLDEGDEHISIDCQENVGSYDPNDKAAFPQGAANEHFIEQNIDLEYKIRFQNTGTDTAFTVVVLDTLSAHLDIETLRPGSASHSYDLDILPNRVLRWTFSDILLPDSTTNEPASNGFFSFKISQHTDVDLGSLIENSAAIYFDFNEPVITNTVFHTIGEDFLEVVGTQHVFVPNVAITIAPNPSIEEATINVSGLDIENALFELYDVNGRLIHHQNVDNQQFVFRRNALPDGLYFYQLNNNNQLIGSGKIVLK